MEKSVTKTKKAAKINVRDKLIDAFIEHKLIHGAPPASIFQFVKSLKMTESEFYEEFNSFEDLEAEIWNRMFLDTREMIISDPVYAEYSVREKLLSFYYSFIEKLKANRSYILAEHDQFMAKPGEPASLKRLKKSFSLYTEELIIEGKDTTEIAQRPFIDGQYDKLFWLQLLFVIRFWIKDDSRGFEKTDAAIEKAVNLSFDLIGKGAIDSVIDFAKFMYQNKWN